MADNKISGYGAMAAWAAGDLMEIVDVSDTSMAGSGTNKKTTLQDLMTVFTGATGMNAATETTSKPLLNHTQTWNAGGATFTAWKLNVTNTASATGTMLADLQVGGSSLFAVRKDGSIYLNGASTATALGGVGLTGPNGGAIHVGSINGGVYLGRSEVFGADVLVNAFKMALKAALPLNWSSDSTSYGTPDTGLARNAAGVVEVHNGTPGTYRDLRLRSVRMNATAVASLVAASTAGEGALAWVNDATAVTARSTVAGGGSNKVLVMSDGTNWLIVA